MQNAEFDGISSSVEDYERVDEEQFAANESESYRRNQQLS